MRLSSELKKKNVATASIILREDPGWWSGRDSNPRPMVGAQHYVDGNALGWI